MRLSTLFFLIVGAAALATIGWVFRRATAETREWNELASWSGRELDVAARDRLQALIQRLAPGGLDSGMRPDRVLKLEGPNRASRVMVFCSRAPRAIPSGCTLRVHVFNENRTVLSTTSLEAGWREEIEEVRPPLRSDLAPWGFILLTTDEVMHYVLVDHRPLLVRIEDHAGNLRRNTYDAPNWTIGNELPVQTADQWEQSLGSSDKAVVLNSLIWLGGIHALSPLAGFARESDEAVRLFSDTLQRPGVRRKISELTQSQDPWIAESAKLVVSVSSGDK